MGVGGKLYFLFFGREIRYGYDTATGGIDGLIGFGSGLGFSSFFFQLDASTFGVLRLFLFYLTEGSQLELWIS